MDNRERSESSTWVAACAELLAPPAEWEPDLRLARARFAVRADAQVQRRSGRKRVVLLTAAAAIVAAILVPAIPQTHAFAQQAANSGWRHLEQFWYWLTIVRRGPAMMPRLSEVAASLRVRQLAAPATISDAGFTPQLPADGVLSAPPSISVQGPMSYEAFGNATRLTLEIGPTVAAHWSNVSDGLTEWSELTLTQGKAAVIAPPNFDREAFTGDLLREAGMRNRDLIRTLSGTPTTLAALLYGYRSPHPVVGVRDLPLRSGFVTMIGEYESAAGSKITVPGFTLLWSAGDRMYLLSGVPKTTPDEFSRDLSASLEGALSVVFATAPPSGGPRPHLVLHRVGSGNR
ncbi:MAG: hypothetical protein C5B56_12240 [Proteobacteria bacterium]|nr:MAG: hypothetical protein C5B56_12240 [Pseudomonadota bacterium]